MIKWKDGDVVKQVLYDGTEVYNVLLKVHPSHATALPLYEEVGRYNDFTIMAKQMMHTDLAKVKYIPARNLEEAELVRSMNEEELTDLVQKVASIMGAPAGVEYRSTDHDTTEKLLEKISELGEMYSGLASSFENLMEDITKRQSTKQDSVGVSTDLIRAEAERDVYKSLYLQLVGVPLLQKSIPVNPIDTTPIITWKENKVTTV